MPRRREAPITRSAFSLLELLVVIGIIVLLMVLLLSSMNRAREMSRRTVCLSNVRQLTQAWMMYASANHGRLCNSVGNPQWLLFDPQASLTSLSTPVDHEPVPLIPNGQLFPYVKDKRVYVCPTDPQSIRNTSAAPPPQYVQGASGTSYSMNYLLGMPQTANMASGVTMMSQIKRTTQRMVFFEGNDGWMFNGGFTTEVNSYHPSTSGSMGVIAVSFADGHAIMWTLNTWGAEQRQFLPVDMTDNDQFSLWLEGIYPRNGGQ